jgi:hypothetical protein
MVKRDVAGGLLEIFRKQNEWIKGHSQYVNEGNPRKGLFQAGWRENGRYGNFGG